MNQSRWVAPRECGLVRLCVTIVCVCVCVRARVCARASRHGHQFVHLKVTIPKLVAALLLPWFSCWRLLLLVSQNADAEAARADGGVSDGGGQGWCVVLVVSRRDSATAAQFVERQIEVDDDEVVVACSAFQPRGAECVRARRQCLHGGGGRETIYVSNEQ